MPAKICSRCAADKSSASTDLRKRRVKVVHRQRGDEGREMIRIFGAEIGKRIIGDPRPLGGPTSSSGGLASDSTCCMSPNSSIRRNLASTNFVVNGRPTSTDACDCGTRRSPRSG